MNTEFKIGDKFQVTTVVKLASGNAKVVSIVKVTKLNKITFDHEIVEVLHHENLQHTPPKAGDKGGSTYKHFEERLAKGVCVKV